MRNRTLAKDSKINCRQCKFKISGSSQAKKLKKSQSSTRPVSIRNGNASSDPQLFKFESVSKMMYVLGVSVQQNQHSPNSYYKIECVRESAGLSDFKRFKVTFEQANNRTNTKSGQKSDSNRLTVTRIIFHNRYIFLEPIQGTPFYLSMDLKLKQKAICQAVNDPCNKLLEMYFCLKNTSVTNEIIEVLPKTDRTYILYKAPKDDMLSILRKRKSLPEEEARFLFRQMCNIVKTCHEQGIVLRGIKLRKFLFIDEERKCLRYESLEDAYKLDNYDDDKLLEKKACPVYVAPEVLELHQPYAGRAADMWSLGVVLYSMVVGKYPFADVNPKELFLKIKRCSYMIPDSVSPALRCLIRSLMRLEPNGRLKSADIFYHPWMTTPSLSSRNLGSEQANLDSSPSDKNLLHANANGTAASNETEQIVPDVDFSDLQFQ